MGRSICFLGLEGGGGRPAVEFPVASQGVEDQEVIQPEGPVVLSFGIHELNETGIGLCRNGQPHLGRTPSETDGGRPRTVGGGRAPSRYGKCNREPEMGFYP